MPNFVKSVVLPASCAASCVVLIVLVSLARVSRARDSDELRPGEITEISCAADKTQSYALYLPSAYTPAKKWPIIYFFDPAGIGRVPLVLYKDIGEKYGFILAGSNNSRTLSSDQSKIVTAFWQDTHARLALDPRRLYTGGFSGGAQVAGSVALSCSFCQIVGVIAEGAGYPSDQDTSWDKLLYFFAIGDRDFDWPDIMVIRGEREQYHQPYRVRVFPGLHQWAPSEVIEDAMQWFVLNAMKSGDLPRNQDFIQRRFDQMQQEASTAEKSKDALDQLSAYRSLVSFAGLRDVSEVQKKLDALKKSSALKEAEKSEKKQIQQQYVLEDQISPMLSDYIEETSSNPNELRMDIIQAMIGLKEQADHSKDESKRLVAGRAFDHLWVGGIESGEQDLQARHFEKAENCFNLLREIQDDPLPYVLLAKTHAAEGKQKEAISDLQHAVRKGFNDAAAITSDKQLQLLKTDPEFQSVLSEMNEHGSQVKQ